MINAFVLVVFIGGLPLISLDSLYFHNEVSCKRIADRVTPPIKAECKPTRVNPREVQIN